MLQDAFVKRNRLRIDLLQTDKKRCVKSSFLE